MNITDRDAFIPTQRYIQSMSTADGDRSKFFPAIEKKYGERMTIWFDRLNELGDAKYADQISYLRENFGFSQVHANAVVMTHRGSASSKKFNTPEIYFKSIDPLAAKKAKEIFATIMKKYPKMELVIAWNQPMLRLGSHYIFGLSAAKKHLLINPFLSADLMSDFKKELATYEANKKTVRVPFDWKVDSKLLLLLVKARLAEVSK